MTAQILTGAGVGLIGMLSLIAGAVWRWLSPPGVLLSRVVLHVAAGSVFAGLVQDVLPRLLRNGAEHPWALAGGMAGGRRHDVDSLSRHSRSVVGDRRPRHDHRRRRSH